MKDNKKHIAAIIFAALALVILLVVLLVTQADEDSQCADSGQAPPKVDELPGPVDNMSPDEVSGSSGTSVIRSLDEMNWETYTDPTGRFRFDYPAGLEAGPRYAYAPGNSHPEVPAELVSSFHIYGDMSEYVPKEGVFAVALSVFRSNELVEPEANRLTLQDTIEQKGVKYNVYSTSGNKNSSFILTEVNFLGGDGYLISVFAEYGLDRGTGRDGMMRELMVQIAQSFEVLGDGCFSGDASASVGDASWPIPPSWPQRDDLAWSTYRGNHYIFDYPDGMQVSTATPSTPRFSGQLIKEFSVSGGIPWLLPDSFETELRVAIYETDQSPTDPPEPNGDMTRTGVVHYRQPAIFLHTANDICSVTTVNEPYLEADFVTGDGLLVSVSDVTGYAKKRGCDFYANMEVILMRIADSFAVSE